MAQARLVWFEKVKFVGFDAAGHPVVVSSQEAENAVGLKPTEMLLLALASCSAVDVVRILAKKRQVMTGLDISVHGEQEAEAPWRFTGIHLTYRVRGRALNAEAVRRSIELAEEKYCSVAASLHPQVALTRDVVLEEEPA